MQTDYADTFVKVMLSWMRYLASGVAEMFQSSGAHSSSGSVLMAWFRGNWIGLLIFLILAGIAADWLVWVVRWRPYWLWFRKKRVLLEDDIDVDLDEEQLRRRYGGKRPERPARREEAVLPEAEDYDEDDVAPRKPVVRLRPRGAWEVPEEAGDAFDGLLDDLPEADAPEPDEEPFEPAPEDDEDPFTVTDEDLARPSEDDAFWAEEEPPRKKQPRKWGKKTRDDE